VKGHQVRLAQRASAQFQSLTRQVESLDIVAVPPVRLAEDMHRAKRVFIRRTDMLALQVEGALQMLESRRVFA